MTLQEAVQRGTTNQVYFAIYAKAPFAPASECRFIPENDYDLHCDAARKAGLSYFLDSEDLKPIYTFGQEKSFSEEQILDAAIYYAVNDAFPGWCSEV